MSTTPPTAVFECYVRTPDFEAHASTLELSPALWDIFALTEERTSAADVVRRLGIELSVAQLGLHELVHCRLLRKHVQRWQDYRAAKTPPPVAGPVAATALARVRPSSAVPPAEATAAVAPAPAAVPLALPRAALLPIAVAKPVRVSGPQEIRFSFGPLQGRRPPPPESRQLIRFSLRRTSAAPDADAVPARASARTVSSGWRLRPILDAIVRHGGGGVPGQLLAYRVFLRVPAELLDQAGLHSLNLADDDFTIRDPELHAAILQSMRVVAGLEGEGLGQAVEPIVSAFP